MSQPEFDAPMRPLRLWHPEDSLVLLHWGFFRPRRLYRYCREVLCVPEDKGNLRIWISDTRVRLFLVHGLLLNLLFAVAPLLMAVGFFEDLRPLYWEIQVQLAPIFFSTPVLAFVAFLVFGSYVMWDEENGALGLSYWATGSFTVVPAYVLTLYVVLLAVLKQGFAVNFDKFYKIQDLLIADLMAGLTTGLVIFVAIDSRLSIALRVILFSLPGLVMPALGFFEIFVQQGLVPRFEKGIAFGTGLLLSNLRLPFFVFELPMALWQSRRAESNPLKAFLASPAGFDDLQVFPQPGLDRIIFQVLRVRPELGSLVIYRVLLNPFQRWACQKALAEYFSAQPENVLPLLRRMLGDPSGRMRIRIRPSVDQNPELRLVLLTVLSERKLAHLPWGDDLGTRLTYWLQGSIAPSISDVAAFYLELLIADELDCEKILAHLRLAHELPQGEAMKRYVDFLLTCCELESLEDIGKTEPVAPGDLPAYYEDETRNGVALLGEIIRDLQLRKVASSRRNKLEALSRTTAKLQELRELVLVMDVPEKVLFSRILERWSAMLGSLSEREGRTSAEPLHNPYVVGLPVMPPLFAGRSEVFSKLEDLLATRPWPPSILLYGHRRMGKTSILRNLPARLADHLTFVNLDMQFLASQSTALFLRGVATAIGNQLRHRGPLEVPQRSEFEADPLATFRDFLQPVWEILGARRLVLGVDEFENLAEKVHSGIYSVELFAFLRSLSQGDPGLTFVFAGLHSEDDMVRDYQQPFWSNITSIKLTYLDFVSAHRLITNPSADFAVDYDQEAVNLIYEATAGQPYLIQQICRDLVDELNQRIDAANFDRSLESTELRIGRANVERILPRLLDMTSDSIKYFGGVRQQVIAPLERAILDRVAGRPEPYHLAEFSHLASTGDLTTALGNLVRLDILRSVDLDGEPAWRFQIDLMRQWIHRHGASAQG